MAGLQGAKRSVDSQLEDEVNANRRLQEAASKVEHVTAGREKDMGGVLREVTAEHAAATTALRHERGERERLAAKVEAGRAREAALADRLRAETVTPL